MPDPKSYTVGWICAITTESVAARAFLDEEHDGPSHIARHDNNSYVLGKISSHNVVIAVLPDGEYGTTSAAAVARDMLHSFPNVRIGLMVGIGGGAPSLKHDIRLGDVVVSGRNGEKGGAFQYDFGKTIQNEAFHETGFLDQPPMVLRTAVSALRATYELKGHQLADEVEGALKGVKKRKKYMRPAPVSDRLYKPNAIHPHGFDNCDGACDRAYLVLRDERDGEDDDPAIHYGLVASANQLMKDAFVRDKLATEKGVLCFEMEAAGLMNHFPCLVIRGICDYSDSHKNVEWQGFAAMMAAAYAKDLLRQIPPNKVEAESRIGEVLGLVRDDIKRLHQTTKEANQRTRETNHAVLIMKSDDHLNKLNHWLSPPDYSTNDKLARERRHTGTGAWLLENLAFQEWLTGTRRHLWLYGLAGCGKTVLSTTIIDHLWQPNAHITLAFFFDFNDTRKQSLEGLLRSLAIQLYHTGGEAVRRLDNLFASHGNGHRQPDTGALSACVKSMMGVNKVIVVLDALDECTTKGELVSWMRDFVSDSTLDNTQFIATSRPEAEFQREIPRFLAQGSCFSLEKQAVDADIRSYVTAKLAQSPDFVDKKLSQDLLDEIRDKVGDGADGMFRWAACQLDSLAKCLSPNAIQRSLKSLPRDLGETYDRMLQSIPTNLKPDAIRLLQFLVHAKRPLQVSEAMEVVATKIDQESQGFDVGNRLCRDDDIVCLCPSLVLIAHSTEGNKMTKELRLSHFSVQEYLLGLEQFNCENASIVITRTCLSYLTDIKGSFEEIKRYYPMARFAAKVWTGFAASAEGSEDIVRETVNFFQDDQTFQRWAQLHQADMPWDNNPGHPQGSKLYYACLNGLSRTAQGLLAEGADVHVQGGHYGAALQAASAQDHEAVVQLLLDEGADIHVQGGHYGTALQAASAQGYEAIVRLLLDDGADVLSKAIR